MAEFDYLALDTAGRERRGQVAADSAEAARARLGGRRLYVVRVDPATAASTATTPLLSFEGFGARCLSAKQLTVFTRQLATLARVTPLEEALRTIAGQSDRDAVRAILARVHAGVVEGRRLSEAMAREPKSFPALYRAMVAAGEGAGTLPRILERLALLLERQSEIRAKLITAVAYPAVLAVVAIFVVAALMIFVVPKIVDQFDTINASLPLLTRVIIGISWVFAHLWWAILGAVGAGVLLAAYLLRNERFRLKIDTVWLRVPLLGRLTRDLHAARMARTLATMVGSRLPLLEGLILTARTVNNRRLRLASDAIVEAVRRGGSLSGALRRTGLFPPLLVTLAASGEAAGELDSMLERAADYLEREFDSFTATMLSLLEPAIIVAMGAVVATIVLAILLPLLQLETLVGT